MDNSGKTVPTREVATGELDLDTQIATLEEAFSQEYMAYLKSPSPIDLLSLNQIRQVLRKTDSERGIKTAVIYIVFGRTELNENAALICPDGDRDRNWQRVREDEEIIRTGDRLLEAELGWPCDRHPEDPVEVVVVTGLEKPVRIQIPEAHRARVEQLALELRGEVTDLKMLHTTSYLQSSQELYRLLIDPIESTLKQRGIKNLLFVPDAGLRTLPFAALHDGEKFLIESYSLAIMPSFSLTQPTYQSLKTERVLAMGASQFTELPPLPAVPQELENIVCSAPVSRDNCWPGQQFLNHDFTLNRLQRQVGSGEFRIVHLATHTDFQPGQPEHSYIQLWENRLQFAEMKALEFNASGVELLVLSSCRTAVGDEASELGFAGLALQSGAKSAIASLWYVSDDGTLGLMSELYLQLRSAPIRAEALRQSQLQLLRGNVRFNSGQLIFSDGAISLPKTLSHLQGIDLSHPYYWAGFTAIGNPW
jgi:CHAT domain-containing protein